MNAGRTIVGLLIISAAAIIPAGFVGFMATRSDAVGRPQISTQDEPAPINGSIVIMCASSTKDMLYLYKNTSGQPVGIAVVPNGCADAN